jgi:succinoglycan biosynthesis protein ExoA
VLPTPSVSYLVPVLNEALRLPAAVKAILGQEYEGPQEVVIAVAPSTDGTADVAARLAARDARVRVVENPRTDIPVGLNVALAASTGEVVVRVDSHTELPPGYTAQVVAALVRSGAANVGGVMKARGRTPFQRSVARAYNSGLGLGGGPHHAGTVEGPAETAYLGSFRRDALLSVGAWDETLRRGEDYELNQRLLAAGHEVWLLPHLDVTYWPRDGWAPLARQMYATGVWRGELVRRQGRTAARYLAAPALVVGLAASAVVRATGLDRRRPVPFALAHAAPVAYTAFLGHAATRMGAERPQDRLRDAAVLTVIQTTWGVGFVKGVLGGAGSTVDSSRLRRSTS